MSNKAELVKVITMLILFLIVVAGLEIISDIMGLARL